MLVGLCGQAGVGKDAIADFLVANHGFVKIALADPIKRSARDWFGWKNDRLWGPSEKRNEIDPDWGISARHALQIMGTEVGRSLNSELWVRMAVRDANLVLSSGVLRSAHFAYTQEHGIEKSFVPFVGKVRGVVISDVRFRNEVEALKKSHAKVVRVVRDVQARFSAGPEGVKEEMTPDEYRTSGNSALYAGQNWRSHPSETEQRSIPDSLFDFHLENQTQSLDVLEKAVAGLVGMLQKK